MLLVLVLFTGNCRILNSISKLLIEVGHLSMCVFFYVAFVVVVVVSFK